MADDFKAQINRVFKKRVNDFGNDIWSHPFGLVEALRLDVLAVFAATQRQHKQQLTEVFNQIISQIQSESGLTLVEKGNIIRRLAQISDHFEGLEHG